MSNEKPKDKHGQIYTIIRFAGFIKPYFGLLFFVLVLNTIFSVLSTISIAIIKPIIQLLFEKNLTQQVTQAKGTFTLFESLKDGFFNSLRNIIYVEGNFNSTLLNLSMFVISIFIVKNIFKYFGAVAKTRLDESVVKSIRDVVYKKMTSLSVEFFTKRKSGNLISVITNDVNVLSNTVLMSFTDILRESIQILIYLILLISISPFLVLISFATSIVTILILRFSLKYLRRYASRMQNAVSDYTTILQETIMGIRVVKSYNNEKTAVQKFSQQTSEYIKSALKHTKVIAMIPSINEVFAIISLCLVLYVGGTQVLVTKTMKADDLMLFLFSLFAIMSPIATTFNSISSFQRGFVSAERVFDIIDQKPTVETGKLSIKEFKNVIEVTGVSFDYNTDASVLKNVSFKIERGKKVALVGASGSGKSTMLDLLIRFYDPLNGNIYIDGTDIRNYTLESYRSMFGIVSQETLLFHESISNNIRYGREDASLEEIQEAAKLANAYNFINTSPKGFDTIVGDRGIILSGGEKQRIAIARALVRNPQILVFDEATSSLDAESEKVVQEAINNSLKDRTAIIVAHRLSTIIDCDKIIVFDYGKIVEHGTHAELFEKNGIYRKLYEIQFST